MHSLTNRELTVRNVRLLMQGGLSLRAACDASGTSPANVLRWEKQIAARAAAADQATAAGAKRGGRPREWPLCAEDRQRLRWLVATPCSVALAVEYFWKWAESGTCPLPVSDKCRRACPALRTAPAWGDGTLAGKLHALYHSGGRWDAKIPKFLRQLCTLTELEKQELRGDKARNESGFRVQRVMAVRVTNEVSGEIEELPIQAGWMFCSDDMSVNEPVQHAQGIGRQLLATHCVQSRRWLGANFIGRRGDAYTAVDISDHFRHVVTAVGLPFYWVLERGPWDCDFVNGCAVPDEWSEASGWRMGGLKALFHVRRKFVPQAKTIEGAFNYFQARMAGHALSVGRRRGQHEKVSKLIERAKDGNEEALSLIWSAAEAMECIWERMMEMNARPVRRACFGDTHCIPNELWKESFQRRPLAAADEWLLQPVKVARVTRHQSAYVKLDGYGPLPFQFRMVGDDLPWRMLDNGHRVGIAFHPDEPHRGATIVNLERRAAWLRGEGFRFGEVLGCAPWVKPAPMEDMTGTGDYTHQRAARAAVRQEVRAGGMDDAGMVRISRAGDALGNALKMSNQEADAVTDEPPPVPARRSSPVRSLAAIIQSERDAAAAAAEEFPSPAAGAWAGVE